MEGVEWFLPGMFLVFIATLACLMKFHHHKMLVVGVGFAVMSLLFVLHEGVEHWLHHFMEAHRSHLLLQLAMLLPGFALAAHYFEHSGASRAIARRLDTGPMLDRIEARMGRGGRLLFSLFLSSDILLLWIVFWLSTVLDNIAAAMIGGTILMARYGAGNVPFRMIVGTIAASNLGGAGSPVGDTTTVMMFISSDPVIPMQQIFMAFAATVPAQFLLALWASRHTQLPLSGDAAREDAMLKQATALEQAATIGDQDDTNRAEEDAHALAEGLREKGMNWRMVLPLLAVPGLIIGNLLDQPGLGLWSGLLLGMLLGWVKFERRAVWQAVPNTIFLVTLVGAAEMLPFQDVVPWLQAYIASLDVAMTAAVLIGLVVVIGLLSAFFDNIPLMAVCLTLMRLGVGLDRGLTAYCLGFEGSAMWFGSSAGVAIGLQFKEVYDTKRWLVPYFVVTGIYLVGVLSYVTIWYGLVPLGIQMLYGY